MASIPHMKGSRAVPRLLSLIRESPVPVTVDADFLAQRQFADPQAVLSLLRSLGFVEKGGRPTKRWTDSQDPSRSAFVLADALRASYAPLFAAYAEAHAESDQALAKVLTLNTAFDNRAIQTALATFRRLCAGADFGSLPQAAMSTTDHGKSDATEPAPVAILGESGRRRQRPTQAELRATIAAMGLESGTAEEAIRCLEHGLNSQACVTIWNAYMELVRLKLPSDSGSAGWTPDRHLIDRLLAADLCTEDEHGWLVPLLNQRHSCAHALGEQPNAEGASWCVEVMLEQISVLLGQTTTALTPA